MLSAAEAFPSIPALYFCNGPNMSENASALGNESGEYMRISKSEIASRVG
jgi:hypothetical protein